MKFKLFTTHIPLVSSLVVNHEFNHFNLVQRSTQGTLAADSVILPQASSILLQRTILNSLATRSLDLDSTAKPWESDTLILKFKNDEVVRVMDSNTVKLKNSGLVSFAAVRTPSGYSDGFRFPDCFSKSPASKARQLLPQGTQVKVKLVGEPSGSKTPALIVIKSNGKLVNAELIRTGFARQNSRGRDILENTIPGLSDSLSQLQQQAEANGLGMYKQCDVVETAADDQFEPLDFTVETRYGEDGGKQVRVEREIVGAVPPNPGDVRKCADFETYEDALRWYDKYLPFYGDVAKLDRDGDGVPCSGLPHTQDQSRYRMKKPTKAKINETY
jgi:endonuclease YncB( thermonuclease family)